MGTEQAAAEPQVQVRRDEVAAALAYRTDVLHVDRPVPDGLPLGRTCMACGGRQSPAYVQRGHAAAFACRRVQHDWQPDHHFPFMVTLLCDQEPVGRVMVTGAHPADECDRADPDVRPDAGWHWHIGRR